MNLTMDNLRNCFNSAKELKYNYVAVKIDMQGFEKPEVIINEKANFDKKLEYYEKAYDDNLVLKSFNGIRIVGFTFADVYEDIEADLINAGACDVSRPIIPILITSCACSKPADVISKHNNAMIFNFMICKFKRFLSLLMTHYLHRDTKLHYLLFVKQRLDK